MTDGKDIIKWGDAQQFHAEPPANWSDEYGVLPSVHMLWMTPDPLYAIAAMSEMYKGHVVRDLLADLTFREVDEALIDVQQTHLQAPLEAVKLHFMIDGVDRAFTHQLVRQRTAVYAQESLRFAVLEDLVHGTSLPPSLHETVPWPHEEPINSYDMTKSQAWRDRWDETLRFISDNYEFLVADGMPAEEARGLIPHAVATRLNYVTDLRNLLAHAGNRLCTQAQFHWRLVFSGIVHAIRTYDPMPMTEGARQKMTAMGWEDKRWQYRALADSGMFKPVCYQLNRCPFKASFDRHCSIRDRVNAFVSEGVDSKQWHEDYVGNQGTITEVRIKAINESEWLMNPDAARVRL